MHRCVNVVTGPDGEASAVLLRAGEVVEGVETARARRTAGRTTAVTDRDLARGPGRLTEALGLGAEHDRLDLLDPQAPVTLLSGDPVAASRVRSGPRVGVSGEGGDGELYPWRFWLDGEPSVSVYRPATRRLRRAAR